MLLPSNCVNWKIYFDDHSSLSLLSNACVSIAEASVSIPDDSCNCINKKLTDFEKEHFFFQECNARKIKFRDFFSAITNSSALLKKFAVFV